MSAVVKNGRIFELHVEQMDVTSMHRPDPGWRHLDPGGHLHQWYDMATRTPATRYDPTASYDTPTLVWIKDGTAYYPDGEPYDIGHLECRRCKATVTPGYTADTYQVFIPGLRSYRIDGVTVTEEEFTREYQKAGGHP